jgi:hypothetical protein
MITGNFGKITAIFSGVDQGALSLPAAGLILLYWTGADLSAP